MTTFLIIFCVFCFIMAMWKASDDSKQKARLKKSIDVSSQNNNISEETDKLLKETETNKNIGDIIYENIEKIRELNTQLETLNEPVVLENIKSEMEVLINDCIELERLYPNATCKLKDAHEKLQRVKERYNERIYLIVKKSLNDYNLKMVQPISENEKDSETASIFGQIQYIQGFIDKTAINHQDCLDSFIEFHNEVEDLFSNLMYNDLRLSEAFTVILEKETLKSYIADIAKLISNDELNKGNLGNVLKEYHIKNIRDIKLDLLDLLLCYINLVLSTYIITENEKRNIELLKLLFKIKEGDFYKSRYNEIKSICKKQFERTYRDNYISPEESVFRLEMQSIFDLSYSQMNEFKKDEIIRALNEGANIIDLDTDGQITKKNKNKGL